MPHPTKPAHFTLMIEENMKQLREEALVMFDLKVIYWKCMANSNSPGCSSQQGQIQEIKKMGLTTPKNEQSRLS